jgi:hypothetical protein
MKYVIIDDIFAIVFNEAIPHDRIGLNRNVTSAGFCQIQSDNDDVEIKVYVYGKSIGLGIESKEDDAEIIKQSIEFRM